MSSDLVKACPVCDEPISIRSVTCSKECAAEWRRMQTRRDPFHGQPSDRDPRWLAQWRNPEVSR